jgi:hypothetical protein
MPGYEDKEEKPWFGKRCTKCNAPINYAYKGVIEGWCGKCTDELRRSFREDLRREILAERPSRRLLKVGPQTGGGNLVLGLVVGLVLGVAASVGAAVYSPELWKSIVTTFVGAGGKR